VSGHAFESRILSMATLVAADEIEARQWYRSDPISRLDGRTAHELVQAGRGLAVLDFLLDVLRLEMPTQRFIRAVSSTSEGGPRTTRIVVMEPPPRRAWRVLRRD